MRAGVLLALLECFVQVLQVFGGMHVAGLLSVFLFSLLFLFRSWLVRWVCVKSA